MNRKICIVTGSRADYGLMYWLLHALKEDPQVCLQVVVTGMHLSPEFGMTVRVIEEDGFHIDERIEMLLSSDTPVAITKSVGLATISFADTWERLKPDLVIVLGDRFEILAAAQAAVIARIPIAHLHGGERTEGAIDEAIRHTITKMSYLHFVATDEYRNRVIQMGENPERVFNFGALGLDNIRRLSFMTRNELEANLGMSLDSPLFLITYHPVTLLESSSERAFGEILKALESFPTGSFIFTGSNADTEGRCLGKMIAKFVSEHSDRAKYFINLGQKRYLSLLREVDAVIGNSSSALIEAPALCKPSVNIGDRQKGRFRAISVIDCPEESENIRAAIEQALSKEFRFTTKSMVHPFGKGCPSESIHKIIKSYPLHKGLQKAFFDLPISNYSVFKREHS